MAQSGWKPGRWSAICDRCGFQFKSDEIKLEWDGLRVCSKCWETRHPQELIRVRPEKIVPPWTRPEPPDVFGALCDIWTSSPMANFGTAGCMRVGGNTSIQTIIDNLDILGTYALPQIAISGITISGVIR